MGDPGAVVALVTVAAVVAAVLAPFESLGWWAGWFGRRSELEGELAAAAAARPGVTDPHRYYVVFLSGIGTLSEDQLLPTERDFLADLAAALPAGGALTHVFPYSAQGRSLTGTERYDARFWRLQYRLKTRHGGAVTGLVNFRNLLQVLVSADSRYGPVFSYGLSRQVLRALMATGYVPREQRPVFLVGYSGGGQMSVGAATFLKGTLGSRVEVVSLGGVISADPGLDRVDRLTRVYGTVDVVQRLGEWLLPPRWPHQLDPRWHRAEREGRVEHVALGPIRHVGPRSYLDPATVLDDGRTPRQRTVDTICAVVARQQATSAA